MKHAFSTLALALIASCGLTAQAATLQVTVLDRDGKPLPNAVVIVEPHGVTPKAPARTSATILQQKMQFVPEVSVVPLGSTVRFTNLDRYEHHVRGRPAGMAGLMASGEAGLELRLDGQVDGKPAASADATLDKPGPVQLGCHLHGSMRGFVFVADSPWAVRTGEDGVATVPDLPEGAARVRIWHPEQLLEGSPTALTITPDTSLSIGTRVVPRRRRI
jgi:plastocyanin